MTTNAIPTFASARFAFEGALVFIVNAENPEERINVRDVVAHATKDIEGTMDQWRSEKSDASKVSLSFGDEWFVKNLSREQRSALNARQHRIMLAVYDGLLATGLTEQQLTYSVGYSKGQGSDRRFISSLRIFFNSGNTAQATQAKPLSELSIDELTTKAVAAGMPAKEAMGIRKEYDGFDAIAKGEFIRRIKELSSSSTGTSQSNTPTTAPTPPANSDLPM